MKMKFNALLFKETNIDQGMIIKDSIDIISIDAYNGGQNISGK